MAVFLIFVQIAFKISLGPTTYVIAGEMASSRVRAQTIVIGRALYVCGQIAVQQLNPRMLNNDPTAWNWGAKTGMFYFGFCLIWVIWIFFFLPETKDRSFAEIDYLFKKKTPARKFRGAAVDCKFQSPSYAIGIFKTDVCSKYSSSCQKISFRRTLVETTKVSSTSLSLATRSALLDDEFKPLSFVRQLRDGCKHSCNRRTVFSRN